MNKSKLNNMRIKLILIFLLLFFTATYGYSQDSQISEQIRTDLNTVLSRLEKNMSGIKTIKTEFIQEKELAVFKQKIVLKGSVYIEKPSRLAWHHQRPQPAANRSCVLSVRVALEGT